MNVVDVVDWSIFLLYLYTEEKNDLKMFIYSYVHIMKTRGQCKKQELEVNIDFDEASFHWKANKKSIGNGQYTYICQKNDQKHDQKNDQKKASCKRRALPGGDLCNIHYTPFISGESISGESNVTMCISQVTKCTKV